MHSFSFPVDWGLPAWQVTKYGIFVEVYLLVMFSTFSPNYKILALFTSFFSLFPFLYNFFLYLLFPSPSINKKISKLDMAEQRGEMVMIKSKVSGKTVVNLPLSKN